MKREIIYVALSIIFNVAASFTLKAFVAQKDQTLFDELNNISFYLAIVFFGINFLFYSKALQSINLSILYPIIVGASALLIILLSMIFLHERLEVLQCLGVCLVIIGILLIYSM
jgi:undecaprenyl phosphate-alpha-L-ara4N flippase subunit ArnE